MKSKNAASAEVKKKFKDFPGQKGVGGLPVKGSPAPSVAALNGDVRSHGRSVTVKLTQQQVEAHLWGAANILRNKTAGQDYKNYILSLMFYKRLCDQWENEADEAIAEQERQQRRQFSDAQKATFRARGEHRFSIPDGSRWGDVLAASTNLGEKLTTAMRAVRGGPSCLDSMFHSLRGASRCADYAAVSRVVRLSQYTCSGVLPSSARCGLVWL
jgi:HsdM N-terminal domain